MFIFWPHFYLLSLVCKLSIIHVVDDEAREFSLRIADFPEFAKIRTCLGLTDRSDTVTLGGVLLAFV